MHAIHDIVLPTSSSTSMPIITGLPVLARCYSRPILSARSPEAAAQTILGSPHIASITMYARLKLKKHSAHWLKTIQKDLDRTFPTHPLFAYDFH